MNDNRLTRQERYNIQLANALRDILDEVFLDDEGIGVEFDGGDGIVTIIGTVPFDGRELLKRGRVALDRFENDVDEEDSDE